jgi:hypothetical protein
VSVLSKHWVQEWLDAEILAEIWLKCLIGTVTWRSEFRKFLVTMMHEVPGEPGPSRDDVPLRGTTV